MNISAFSVKRPVTITMFYLAIILLGAISYIKLPQELFPPINYPRLSIVTHYINAAPEEIETLITRPIEEAVGAVTNMRGITSISKEGSSIVTVSFNWGTNMDFASLNVREKIDLIKDRFPRESEDPVVIKFNPFDLPVLRFSVTGEMDGYQLRKLSERIIKDGLEKVEGVASVSISGGLKREILINVDQGRLEASGVAITDIVNALDQTNLNYPAGTIKDDTYEYLIRTIGEYKNVREIGFTPVSIDTRRGTSEDRAPALDPLPPSERQTMSYLRKKEEMENKRDKRRLIFLKEIAEIKDTYKKQTSYSRLNGKQDISISIQKQSATNTIKVVKNVLTALKKLRSDFPEQMHLDIIYDQSEFIKQSINGVRNAAVQGGILAFIVILFFLRNIRSALIVTFSIPISVLGTFIMMYFKGELFTPMSLNMMSLGGLALVVGMLVDNAIVVIENIFRYREMGYDKHSAAVSGSNEVTSAIVSSTLTTVAVFFPLIFVPGLAGQIFKDLAFTVCFGLIASLVVAVTLIPLLATRVKAKKRYAVDLSELKDKLFFVKLGRKRNRIFIFIIFSVVILFLISVFMMFKLDRELLPKVDQGQFMIKVDLPTGSKLDITNKIVKEIESYIMKLDDTKSVAVSVGSDQTASSDEAEVNLLESHQAEILVTLKPDRKKSTAEIIQRIKSAFNTSKMKTVKFQYILQESIFKSLMGTASPIVVKLSGYELDTLAHISDKIQRKISRIPGIYGVKSTKSLSNPETKIEIIKDNAAAYGISVDEIAMAAHTALKGTVATKYKEEGREFDIRVQLRKEDRKNYLKIRELLIHSQTMDISVPLKQVAVISRGYGPSEIKRIDQERTVLVTANIFGRPFKAIVKDVKRVVDKIVSNLPEDQKKDYKIELAGENKEITESFSNLFLTLGLSILLVYMIMASQFESFVYPFIIMFTVPLSLIGIAVALLITHTAISIVVMLGMIMLGGIVVNNGIVLIEFISLLRKQGYSPIEAAFLANNIRRRPIMMSALTTIIGLIPLAIGFGQGSELRSPMAITVMGGLLTSTFLTLFIIPIIYYYVESLRLLVKKFIKKIVGTDGITG
ncbi:efflux RND transporter permease subunit [bacterium]|nr:efflux RND transporter permease subunit [bacterium]